MPKLARLAFVAPFALLCLAAAGPLGCTAEAQGDEAESSEESLTGKCEAPTTVAPGRPQVYFAPFDRPEDEVLCLLDTARSEVVIAHYNIRREKVIAKLVELSRRGVTVKVAVDQDNAKQPYNIGDDAIEAAGIKIVRVSPPGSTSLMHLKAAVIDGTTTLTGSFNWNETAALVNDENMVVFREPEVAKKYRDQILEVIGEKPKTIDGGVVLPGLELHFSPEEKLDPVIVRAIDGAKTSVDIAMYTYTMPNVMDAAVRAQRRGVRVRLVAEKKQAGLSRGDEALEAAGGLVVRAANKLGLYSAMHHKYAVIDDKRVITGASNWTKNGTQQSDEDLLVIDDRPELTRKFRQNFADLLSYYAARDTTGDDATLKRPLSPVVFHVVNDKTSLGDEVRVVGSDPRLGAWDTAKSVRAETAQDLFPNWAAPTDLTAGARVEYKFIVKKSSGAIEWEPGPNRVVTVPATGRAMVLQGLAGDTSQNWTPATPR